MYLENLRPEGIDQEFSETRIGPVADSIIELLSQLPLNDQMEIDEKIRKEIVNHVKTIDSERAEKLRDFFDVHDEVNFYTGFTETNMDIRSEADKQELKEILVSSDLSPEIVYNNLLTMEEMLVDEAEKQGKNEAEKDIQDEKNRRRAA